MRKNFLFGLLAIGLAGFGFGGISLASTIEVANFEELTGAFADASAGDEIVLTADIDISENAGISVDKTLTLNLASHTINYNTNAATKSDYQDLFDVEENGDLTIDGNGTINGPTSGASYDGKVLIAVHGKLTYKNGTMNAHGAGSDGMYGVYILDGGNAIFGTEDGNGPTINAYFAAIGTNNTTAPATIIVYGGTYTAAVDPGSSSTSWHYFCAPIYAAAAGTYDIKGGTFNGFYGISSRYLHLDQSIIIRDGVTISSSSLDLFIDSQGGTTPGNNRIIEAAVNSYTVPDGYIWVQDGDVYKVGHSVAFNSNEGSAVDAQAIVEGKYVVKPTNPTKDDNVFSAWFKEAGLENERDFNSDKVMGNITLYAKWEAMTSSGTAEIAQNDGTGTGMIVEADAPATPTAVATEVQASNSTATIQGEVELDVYNDADLDGNKDGTSPIPTKVNFTSPVVVRIPVNATGSVKVKVRHNGETTFGIEGLTTNSGATCTTGVASDPYDGSDIPVVGGYAEIYTCSASTFVAYTETANPAPSYSGGGGGGSSKSSTKAETKDETDATADTTDADTTGAEEGATEANPTVSAEEQAAVAKFGQEQIDAYKWALANGITTMKTVEAARLDQPLTRAELAKMMVVYIQKVAGKDPVVTGDVTYEDVDESLGDLAGYIKLAYQYQIMGINADGTPIQHFNPHGLVTRGEYATVFSRVLFGDRFNKAGADFYTNHLAALEKVGILKNTTPTIQEIRGWVMLMMYRSSQNSENIQALVAETEEAAAEETASEETAAEETATEETPAEETPAEETATEETATEETPAEETPAEEAAE